MVAAVAPRQSKRAVAAATAVSPPVRTSATMAATRSAMSRLEDSGGRSEATV